jgi:hypothetical protein
MSRRCEGRAKCVDVAWRAMGSRSSFCTPLYCIICSSPDHLLRVAALPQHTLVSLIGGFRDHPVHKCISEHFGSQSPCSRTSVATREGEHSTRCYVICNKYPVQLTVAAAAVRRTAIKRMPHPNHVRRLGYEQALHRRS